MAVAVRQLRMETVECDASILESTQK